jgi:hypothetical protein
MIPRWLLPAALAAAGTLPSYVAAQAPQGQPPQKVEVVSVTGCLTPGPADTWLLTNATDPVAVNRPKGAATPASPAAKPPTVGKNRFKLIGILELNVPAHKGHTVTVRGLLIPAAPEKRINLTSVQMVSDSCAAGT